MVTRGGRKHVPRSAQRYKQKNYRTRSYCSSRCNYVARYGFSIFHLQYIILMLIAHIIHGITIVTYIQSDNILICRVQLEIIRKKNFKNVHYVEN